ncbi:MAG: ABC transporter ATP-binding protein [Bacillota bacterium]|nr:ABC transporter ATP-binding protein [Bacillota bacterium]
MVDLELRSVSKKYAGSEVLAVNNVSLEIEKGELLCLLGPSGCGKTTLLRMIAGFVEPTAGSILVKGQDITQLPPNKRNLGMVFQSYALFPHMTVLANVEYGLRMRRIPRTEARTRAREMLEMVGLLELEHRYPRQLSGGQQQRVALARAMVILPQVLLLDEPLSNLDAKLRQQMRIEIRRIQKEVGITSIFVTHDQEEALTLADRIVVMDKGEVRQVGSPQDVYDHPVSRFVANFIGTCNFLNGVLEALPAGSEPAVLKTDSGLRLWCKGVPGLATGQRLCVAVRPEHLELAPAAEAERESAPGVNAVRGRIEHVSHLGSIVEYHVVLPGGERLRVQQQSAQSAPSVAEGGTATVKWAVQSSMCFPE